MDQREIKSFALPDWLRTGEPENYMEKMTTSLLWHSYCWRNVLHVEKLLRTELLRVDAVYDTWYLGYATTRCTACFDAANFLQRCEGANMPN